MAVALRRKRSQLWLSTGAVIPDPNNGWYDTETLVLSDSNATVAKAGGRISVRAMGATGVEVEASGENVLVNRDVVAALAGTAKAAELTSRTIHGHVTAKFAEQLGASAALSASEPNRALFAATAR